MESEHFLVLPAQRVEYKVAGLRREASKLEHNWTAFHALVSCFLYAA